LALLLFKANPAIVLRKSDGGFAGFRLPSGEAGALWHTASAEMAGL